MKKIYLISTIVMSLFSGACVMNKMDHQVRAFKLRQTVKGLPVTFTFTKGAEFSKPMQAGPIIFNVLPQVVIWAEDPSGKLIDTLYVTGADGKKMRHGAKSREGAKFYKACFPVWAKQMAAAGKKLPMENGPYPDSVTTATPMDSFSLATKLDIKEKSFVLFIEINKSGDFNKTYTEKNNGWAGQPSLIYRADAPEKKNGQTVIFTPVGHGGRLKDKARIYTDLKGIDTALRQFLEIKAAF